MPLHSSLTIRNFVISMDHVPFSALALVVGLLSIAACSILLSWRGATRYKHKRLAPGSLGWPLIGENFEYYFSHTSERPMTFYEDRRRRYGSLFKTNIFGSYTVISLDPDVNRFVLLNEGKLFECRYPQSLQDAFGQYTLLNVHGTLHKKLYGVAVSLMSPEKLRQHFMEDIETFTLNMLESWRNRMVLVEEDVKHFSLSLMAKHLLGFQPGKETEYLATNSMDILTAIFSMTINLPWSTYGKALKARKRIVRMLNQIMKKRRNQQFIDVTYNDILARLMAWEEFPLTDDQIVDFLLFLVLASHETTAMTIACAIKFLAECPRAIQELREEQDRLRERKGDCELLAWNDYKEMVFLRDVITETLRITNVPPVISRRALQDVDVKGYTIPKGWSVIVPVLAMHLDENLFPNPLEFDPWRWKERDEKAEPFLAFGGGPRYCPGSELGRLEVSIFLNHLVTKFNWVLAEPSPISWFPLPRFRNRLPIRVRERKS